jgi:hypothetical protein
MSLYGGGWVTLSGLPFGDSSSTIEHRQQIIDEIVAELRPELNAEIATFHERASAATGARQVREAKTSSWTGVALRPRATFVNSFRVGTEHPNSDRTSRKAGN